MKGQMEGIQLNLNFPVFLPCRLEAEGNRKSKIILITLEFSGSNRGAKREFSNQTGIYQLRRNQERLRKT